MRTGIANLPLHYGKAPAWLFSRMKRLAREVAIWVVSEFGPEEMILRLSDPFWFQAFGCALGFDWHSSGVTTTVCGALKEGIAGLESDLGLFVAGGKGARSRKTPAEIESFSDRLSQDPQRLIYASRMTAKVDNSGLQDGYQLYHHVFLFTKEGYWGVIQQGMNENTRYARRYHWLGGEVKDFVCEPHSAICCDHLETPLNMVALESEEARSISASLSKENPESIAQQLSRLQNLDLPPRHQVLVSDINPQRIKRILLASYETQPRNFEALLGTAGIGPKTIRALALLSELVYGAKVSVRDPVRYSFAHGGKDGHPYPVDRALYNRSISLLKKALNAAKVGRTEKLEALKRLAVMEE
ncbi:MAG: DUF763 domain-containing protein [bacterium]